jgi:hypothetical protein
MCKVAFGDSLEGLQCCTNGTGAERPGCRLPMTNQSEATRGNGISRITHVPRSRPEFIAHHGELEVLVINPHETTQQGRAFPSWSTSLGWFTMASAGWSHGQTHGKTRSVFPNFGDVSTWLAHTLIHLEIAASMFACWVYLNGLALKKRQLEGNFPARKKHTRWPARRCDWSSDLPDGCNIHQQMTSNDHVIAARMTKLH